MKHFILTMALLTTTVTHAGIFKKNYKGADVPKTCEIVFSKEYVETTGSLKAEVAEVLHAAILHTRRILDLKFESHSYYLSNRESYGEYKRFSQIKNDVENGIKTNEEAKSKMIEKSDVLIRDLAILEKNLANKIYNDIAEQRVNEIERYNKIARDFTKFWDKINSVTTRHFLSGDLIRTTLKSWQLWKLLSWNLWQDSQKSIRFQILH